MQTNISKVSEVEYELEITATADDLSKDIEKAIRTQRGRTTMKGFRPGHVPLSLVKKLHGKSLAYGVAEHAVQHTYESAVLEGGEYEVLGQPTITDLTYEYEGDLRAVVRFGIRPDLDLADISSVKLFRLVHEVTDEELDTEIDSMRARHAEMVPEEGPATEESHVVVDMQRLDPETGTPLVGEKQEDVTVHLGDENVFKELKNGLVGKEAGAQVRLSFPGPDGEDDPRTYEIDLKEVKRRELPELDEELIKQISNDRFSELEAFRAEVQQHLEEGWKRRGKELFESEAIASMIKAHPTEVPGSVVDMYLDAYLKEAKEQSGGEFPEGFDEERFREMRRDEAVQQAHWMFIRDRIIAVHSLEVTPEDQDTFFEGMGSEGLPVDSMKQYYQAVPSMMEQLDQKLLTKKVFGWITEQVQVEELDKDAYQEEMKKGEED